MTDKTEPIPHGDLTALFQTNDKRLDPGPFTTRVMGRIARERRRRRIVLAGAGSLGALGTLSQVPAIMMSLSGLGGQVSIPGEAVRRELALIIGADPLWLGVIAVIGLCAVATMALERV